MALNFSDSGSSAASNYKQKKQRMAGEALQTGTPEANEAADAVVEAAAETDGVDTTPTTGEDTGISAQEAGFRNKVEQNFGTEKYDEMAKEGFTELNDKGQIQAREVISEFRDGRNGRSVNDGEGSMVEHYQGLVDSGDHKFNAKAQAYLEKQGVKFGLGGGGKKPPEDDVNEPTPAPEPGPTPEPGPDPLPTPKPTPTPMPNPDPFPMPPGIPGGPGGGFNVGRDLIQNVGKVGDTNTTIGDGNTIGDGTRIGGDYSITLGNNHAGNNGYYRTY